MVGFSCLSSVNDSSSDEVNTGMVDIVSPGGKSFLVPTVKVRSDNFK